MNKNELIKAIAEKSNFSQKDVEIFYDAVVGVLTETLQNGEKIQLLGFANVELRESAEKTGINPRTKEKVIIPASKKPVVKFSKSYIEKF